MNESATVWRAGPRQLASHSALYGLAGALGKALALLTVPILSRLLSPAEYGLADLANTLAAMLAMLALFAGDIPAARLAAMAASGTDRRIVLSSYVWTTGLAGMVVALALLPFASLIAQDLWSAPASTGIVLLAIALIPIGTVQASVVTTLRIEVRPLAFAVLATIDLIGQMVLAVVFVGLGWGALGMVAGLVLGSLIGLAAAAIHTRSIILTIPDWRLGRALVVEGIRFLPAALGFVAANYVVRFLLVDSEGQSAVGMFGVAMRLSGGMALATAAFAMAWGPFGLSLPDNRETAGLFGRVMRRIAIVGVSASVAVGAVGPELVTVMSGNGYAEAATMLPGLLVAASMAGGFYVLLIAAGIGRRGVAVAIAAVVGASLQVGATAALLPVLGLQAVGVAAMIGQATALVILVASIGSSVRGGASAVVVLCVGGVLGAAVQMLNATPDSTVFIRLMIAAMSAAVAAVFLLRLVRRRAVAGA